MFENNVLNYNEQEKGLGTKEAIDEANRCLQCKKPTCKEGCPINNDIPEFIGALAKGNIGEAREIIARKSNLPAVCGRVCAHELQCQGHCILEKKGNPIQIGNLERFIADFAYKMRLSSPKLPAKTRGKIAVIGSGPAGLTVAGDLAKMGFHVTVFEALPEPGGVLLYGIPAFRLPKEVVRREILQIEALGVTFLTNSVIGEGFTVDKLFDTGYDAVFIGSGTAVNMELNLPGKELDGVMQSSYLLRMTTLSNSGQLDVSEVPVQKGDRVLVIGGGNVAIDAARTSLRLGAASVGVVYYRDQSKMSALQSEYESAVEEGVEFWFNGTPQAYHGEDGRLRSLEILRGEERMQLPVDKLFLAVGSRPANRIVSTTEGINVDDNGYVISRERPYGMTTRKGVFAGGDVVHRPATVVLAMKEAKKVAEGIASYVDAVKLLEL